MTGAPDRLFLDFQTALAGRYSLDRELGRGGMGIVYLARDLRLERVIAVKLLPPDRARDAARGRFLREARTAAQLSHPHIIPIHAVEEIGEFVFFVMAYVEGSTLGAQVRRDGPLKPHDAARVLREVAWALAYAHGQGVIHRDVKPDNILLERGSGRALVADFGIARLIQAPGMSGEGELVGTPEYMSPEQATGEGGDGRSDLYSLGVVGYYALSGRLPFTSPTVGGLIAQHAGKTPPPLAVPGAPRALIAAIERCLAKVPADRFHNGEELAAALGGTLEGRRELPVPLRAFLSESRSQLRAQYIGPFLGAAVLVPVGLNWLIGAVFAGHPPAVFRAGVAAIAALLVAAALGSPAALVVRSIRRLLRAGYHHADLVHGLELELARRREEQEFAAGGKGEGPTPWERWMRGKMYASLGLAGLSGVAAFVVPYPAVLVAFGLFGLSCATAVATGIAALAASRARLDDAEQRRLQFWKGRLGRWLFKVAGIGLKRVQASLPVADRPTEVALGLAALELFEALPKETRQRLGDLPDVVRGLEEQVRRLRGNGQETRLGEALGALETIRFDLLRLHGGVGSVDGLTADLSAARRIGEEVDALLEAVREADNAAPGA
ncbi:MAG TPA: serine/threonine-protein kinase [Gemmatimonadales bacterium]|nr:serine/threonine-protein kinase [Gemmatimonadales bacterium]